MTWHWAVSPKHCGGRSYLHSRPLLSLSYSSSRVWINKGHDIGPMRSCSCLVVLSVSGAAAAREVFLPELSPWIKQRAAATTKAFFSFRFPPSRRFSPTTTWASVCFLLLLLMLPRPDQLQGSFRGVVTNCAKAFIFKCGQTWIIVV